MTIDLPNPLGGFTDLGCLDTSGSTEEDTFHCDGEVCLLLRFNRGCG